MGVRGDLKFPFLSFFRGSSVGKVVAIDERTAKLNDFELFWEFYPRRQKKGDAYKAWLQTENIRPCIEEIISAIQEQQRSVQWQNSQFIPLPASWLRAWQWSDE